MPDMPDLDVDLPKELLQALAADDRAAEKFRSLPPSHRREYVQWIASAKQEKTRLGRAAKATEQLRS